MRLSSTIVAVAAALLAFVVLTGDASAAAGTPIDPTPSKSGFTSVLNNLYSISQTLLKYAGFILTFLGFILYFGARSSSDRAQTGLKFATGGIVMIGLSFAFPTLVALIKWIANAGGGGA